MRGTVLILALGLAAQASVVGAGTRCEDRSGFVGEVILGALVPGTVELEWRASSQVRDYRLSREADGLDGRSKLGRQWLATVPASGDGFLQSLTDTVAPGTYVYRLEAKQIRGGTCSSEVVVVVPGFSPCDAAALCGQVTASLAAVELATGGVVAEHGFADAQGTLLSTYLLDVLDGSGRLLCSADTPVRRPVQGGD